MLEHHFDLLRNRLAGLLVSSLIVYYLAHVSLLLITLGTELLAYWIFAVIHVYLTGSNLFN